jgi:2,4-dienoyl-CoA reductase-like NADH-dependent reductase (Old Yellow Enzyme family)
MIQTDALSRTSARRLEPLFQPVRIGDLTLKNRIAMAALSRCRRPVQERETPVLMLLRRQPRAM